MIRELYPKGEEKPICPRLYHAYYIAKTHERPDGITFMQGRYFESALIGTSRDGVVDDLPRDKRNGKKTIDHMRIDDQILVGRQVLKFYHVEVNEHNVQAHLRMPFRGHTLEGHLDIFPTTVLDTINGELLPAIVDVKLTEDVEGTWGNFCWGSPTHMDHTQALHYLHLVYNINNELNDLSSYPEDLIRLCEDKLIHFFYFVFGYKKNKGFRNPIRINPMGKMEAYKETLRKVVSKLEMLEAQGWPPERNADLCPSCPVTDCEMKKAIVDV